VTTAVHTAHQAYRAAAALGGSSSDVRMEFARPAPPPAEGPVRDFVAWSNREMELQTRHLIAAGGGFLALIAGACCGAWLQIG
jgi:hypothetical protein